MSKRKYEFDEQKLARFIKEGRGLGTGADYKPWLTIQDVPSEGLATRVPGIKNKRLHHALSGLERNLIILLDWSDAVADIREQFPLDRDITRQIADSMGVAHPKDPRTRVDIVMTSDVLIDFHHSLKRAPFASAVKESSTLDDPRVIEKLEIERRYWAQQTEKTDWSITTEKELPKQRIANIAWAREMYTFDKQVVQYDGYWDDRCSHFLSMLSALPNSTPLKQLLHALETQYNFSSGEGLTVFRHLIATKVVSINMDQPFSASKIQVGEIQVAQKGGSSWKVA
ncbi:TnsA endonuclease C-terminal domain-containing protein [Chitinibacter sp. S2-10]|uniref:TnsA endonuclease C-terminal domain-containing protein n=1 Tax=Chitinibacter sp. S2-10 TaxID=3373597 RepID=UPI0039775572